MAPQMSQGLETNTGTNNNTNNNYNVPISKQSIRLKYIKLGYHFLITNFFYIVLLPLIPIILRYIHMQISINNVLEVTQLSFQLIKYNLITMFMCMSFLIFFITLYIMSRSRKVYLVDFACYKPNSSYKVPMEIIMEKTIRFGKFSKESIDFQRKILERSGLGQETYFSEALIQIPPNPSMEGARKEAALVMFGAIDELLAKTKVKVNDIGILIVNCSLFNPTPSLSAMIVNHYKLGGNMLCYNLGGMGCSAGIISIDLAKELLEIHGNTYALVVSTENITQNWYLGNDRSMLLPNCLFRMGAAAILLSNKPSDRRRSKYKLIHTIRTHKGAEDKSYKCAYQKNDDNKIVGVSLSKDLMIVAREALKANITTLGPLILPISEQLLFFINLIARKALNKKIKPYIPDFKFAIQHFCIHPGGRGVLDEMEKNLELSPWHMEPSRMTLYRFGNTSSSSLWYELAYLEAKGRIKRGDKTWQIAFGSGFKCNSAIWIALKSINPSKEKNPWIDEIDKFPIQVPKFTSFNSSVL